MKHILYFTLSCILLASVSCQRNSMPQISWSLMHPEKLDSVYMQRIVAESAKHPVNHFEICGGDAVGLDGLMLYEEYPLAAAAQDMEKVLESRAQLRSIVRMAHEAGKEIYFWHREILCNEGVIATFPDLLGQDGEFDLFGKTYEQLLRYKIGKTFELVPDLDGIVLTLTEARYSVLHHSRPDLYPPEKVVAHIGGIFADELEARGKRFIMRTFGSISEDYEAIMAGNALLAKNHKFEVETKITPYDFDPFLPDNPFLVKVPGTTLGAECEVSGEFMGCARMLAEQIEDIVRYARFARKRGVDRITIRLDRRGKTIFDIYPINLYAYEQALQHPRMTADQIRHSYYSARYPDDICDSLCVMSKEGMEVVRKTEYIDGNLIFHTFPFPPKLHLIKAGGILDVFAPNGSLGNARKQWGILSNQDVPGRAQILREKEAAVALVHRNLRRLDSIKERLDAHDRKRLEEAWAYSLGESVSVLGLCRLICAYFDEMEARSDVAPSLHAAFDSLSGSIEDLTLLRPIPELARCICEEYPSELALRKELDGLAVDYVLPGCITDQIRTEHYMHGCLYDVLPGRPVVQIGNPVFPNGYLTVHLKGTEKAATLLLKGEACCRVRVNGTDYDVDLSSGSAQLPLPAAGSYELSVFKQVGSSVFPVLEAIAVI
ncbi:MAG: hypothetical protein IJV01_00285 [Bacteroidales bacterium]|nr:hypothetical protein [Bacteroidales bacterium]